MKLLTYTTRFFIETVFANYANNPLYEGLSQMESLFAPLLEPKLVDVLTESLGLLRRVVNTFQRL